MVMTLVRRIAWVLGVLGCLFFSSAFVASMVNPGFVEQVAKNIIRYEVEKRVREKVDAIDSNFLGSRAASLVKNYSKDIEQAQSLLAAQLPARLAEVIAEMQNLDCECRKKVEANIRSGFGWQIASASAAREHLTALIRSGYMETAHQVIREFRIFTGTNAVVFALLLVALFVKRQAGLHLLPAAIALLAAASITAYLYLFQQNWLHTLVFSDYTGLAYIAYLGTAFALLCDVIFNRARVTAQMLNVALHSLGSIQIAPC
ncbi:MAG: hypothetical protein LBP52_04915 [Burkholderiaceae bacterium]|nr:hypothetical protein [Burkholderiaceae bacterium]